MKVDVKTAVSNEEFAKIVLETVSAKKLLHWYEIRGLTNRYSISYRRLKEVLLNLIVTRKLLELPCRLFTTPTILLSCNDGELEGIIRRKICSLGIRKCGRPLSVPIRGIVVTVRKKGTIISVNRATILEQLNYNYNKGCPFS